MRSGIPYYILMLLELEGQVRIPGIGKLTRTMYPARIDPSMAVLNPPGTESAMEISAKRKGRLLEKFIAYKSGNSRMQVRQDLKGFSAGIRRDITRNGYAQLDHFGTFSAVDGQLVFRAYEDAFNARFAGLRAVTLFEPGVAAEFADEVAVREQATTIAPADETVLAEKIPPPQEAAGTDRKRRVPLFVILLIAIVLTVCIAAYVQYRMKQAALAEQAMFNRSPISEQVTDPPRSNDSVGDHEQPADSGHHEMDSEPAGEPLDPTVPDPPEEIRDAVEEDPISGIDPAGVATPPADAPCLVVLGAFGVQSNVDRMLSRLASLDLEGVTVSRGALTVVGVPVPCTGNDMNARLSRLRSEIEPGAWILKR